MPYRCSKEDCTSGWRDYNAYWNARQDNRWGEPVCFECQLKANEQGLYPKYEDVETRKAKFNKNRNRKLGATK